MKKPSVIKSKINGVSTVKIELINDSNDDTMMISIRDLDLDKEVCVHIDRDMANKIILGLTQGFIDNAKSYQVIKASAN